MQNLTQPLTSPRPVTKTCEGCGQPFTFTARTQPQAVHQNHCEPCWAKVDAARELDYKTLLAHAREDNLRSIFPAELIEPFRIDLAPAIPLHNSVMAWKPSRERHSLFIHGPNDTGKSRSACLLAAQLAQGLRLTPVWRSWPALVSETLDRGSRSPKTIGWELNRAQMLVLDDFTFDSAVKDRALLLAFDIIDGRYRSRRVTLISSNNKPHELSAAWSYSKLLASIQARIMHGYAHVGAQ